MAETIRLEDGQEIALRRLARARRMTLRVPRDGGMPVLTLPPRVSVRAAREFALSHATWLAATRSRLPAIRHVAWGAVVPVEGQGLTVVPGPHRTVRIENRQLLVPATRPVGSVVQVYLKHLATERLRAACDYYAQSAGRRYRSLVIRDTRSRWGSCSSDGRLMFSWRLAMAPPEVLAYVAAHEVAHLAHMDHSPRFWAVVEGLMPGWQAQRNWLRQHGNDLLLWRFETVGD